MKRVFGLLSASMLTQIVLLLTQLLLLPLQVGRWGHGATAGWYAALAIASLATVADLGFRTIGHDDLVRANGATPDAEAGERFGETWAIARVLIVVVAALIGAADLAYAAMFGDGPYPAWRIMLIGAFAAETLLIVRVVYMDSLRLYARAEGGYLSFVSIRLAAALFAIGALGWREPGVAAIYLATAAIGLAAQSLLCRGVPDLALAARPLRTPSLAALGRVRFSLAEPLSNWVKFSLPVLVLAQIGSDRAVTAFLALRAIFSGVRNFLVHASRMVSAEYLAMRAREDDERASALLRLALVAGASVGAGFGAAMLLGGAELARLWLPGLDARSYAPLAASFALAAGFFPHQMLLAVAMREGRNADIARLQYAYLGYSALLAAAALWAGSVALYAACLLASEALLALSAFGMRAPAERRAAAGAGLAAGLAGAGVVALLLLLTLAGPAGLPIAADRPAERLLAFVGAGLLIAFSAIRWAGPAMRALLSKNRTRPDDRG